VSAGLASALPWIQALGWTLLHFTWQGALVGAAFAVVRAFLPATQCHARHAAALGALLVLALCPVATFCLLQPGAIAAAAGATPLADGLAAAAGGAVDAMPPVDRLLPWLVLAWIGGVLVVGTRALHQWHHLVRVARRSSQASDELDALLDSLLQRFGFAARIRVLVSTRIETPMLVGWLKPVILLPAAVAMGLPRQQLELVLAHELGHLRRLDHLVNLGQAVLETLFFFHPAVHWISRELRHERELCCDALVLRQTAGEPREYASALAALEEMRQPGSQLVLAASGGHLLERVRRIIGAPEPLPLRDPSTGGRGVIVAACLALGLGLAVQRESGSEAPVLVAMPAASWLQPPDLRLLPLATVFGFERPRLRLEPVVEPADAGGGVPAPRVYGDEALALRSGDKPAGLPPVVPAMAAVALPRAPVRRGASAATVVASVPPAAPRVAPPPVPRQAVAEVPAANRAPTRPVPLRVVAPRFPPLSRSEGDAIEASFTIDARGRVRDIRIADEGAFSRAAERALRQWRFDPATLPPDRGLRYTQRFVFAPRSTEDCTPATGSHICRRADAAGHPTD
jgi:TonB family protein